MIDLHIHSTASTDGQHTPHEIFEMAKRLGLSAIAFADHNSVGSVALGQSLAREYNMGFAPCVELDTFHKDMDLHVLAYFIDYQSPDFDTWMLQVEQGKRVQTRERVRLLNELGFILDYDELIQEAKGQLPTGNNYVDALLRDQQNRNDPRVKVFVDGPRSDSPALNFYLDYLKAGRPAFVPLKVQPTVGTIQKIKDLGGIPILAHPSDTPIPFVHELIDAGMMGLEVYTSYHDAKLSEKFLKIAKDRKVLITAGSDFHGKKIKAHVDLAGITGNTDDLFEKLCKAAGRDPQG